MNPKQEFISLFIMVDFNLPKNSKVVDGKSFGKKQKKPLISKFIDGTESHPKIPESTHSM